MDKSSIKLATVRFKRGGKQYNYIVPDWCEDKISIGCYVIVPDKVSDKRYQTAQCIQVRTEAYENLNPNINYEYIVDVVNSSKFESFKESVDRGVKLEAIAKAIKDYTDIYGGFFKIEHKIEHDYSVWNQYAEYTFTMEVPLSPTTITVNDTPLIAKSYLGELIN